MKQNLKFKKAPEKIYMLSNNLIRSAFTFSPEIAVCTY